MKREFLESLGLEKDTVDAVMAEYGRGIGAMKQRCDTVSYTHLTLPTKIAV